MFKHADAPGYTMPTTAQPQLLPMLAGVARKRTAVEANAGAVSWLSSGHLISLMMAGSSETVRAQLDFSMGLRGAALDGITGGSHHLRIDKVIFDHGDDPRQAQCRPCVAGCRAAKFCGIFHSALLQAALCGLRFDPALDLVSY